MSAVPLDDHDPGPSGFRRKDGKPWFMDTDDRKSFELGQALRQPIASVEAEQALLGALLCENSAFHLLPADFSGQVFFEPFHERLFESIAAQIRLGFLAEPILTSAEFRRDPAFHDLGGLMYLADLVDKAPPGLNAPAYARQLHQLWVEREIVQAAVDLALGVANMKDGRAPVDQLAEAESVLMKLRTHDRQDEPSNMADAVAGTMAYVRDRSKPAGIKTGLAPLDRHIGFILPGDLIIVGGATGAGKSALGIAISQNIAGPALAAEMNGFEYDQQDRPRGVFTLHGEMTFGGPNESGQAVRRHFADVGYYLYGPKFPTYKAIRNKHVDTVQDAMMEEAGRYLAALPLIGVAGPRWTVPRLQAAIERQCMIWEREGVDPGLAVVDHLGLMSAVKPSTNATQDTTEIAEGLKVMASYLGKKWGMAVVALCQLSRGASKAPGEDKRPIIQDLRQSGAIEQSADMVWLVYRDAYYAQREPDVPETKQVEWAKQDARRRSKEVEVILGKVREGEANSFAKLWVDYAWNVIRGHEPTGIKGGLI